MSSSGWDIQGALQILRGQMDPYLWDQGQELYRRGAAADFAMQADGAIQIKVVDPRDARNFFVRIAKKRDDQLIVVCRCPYRLGGYCRHQVVALEYLRSISAGEEPKTAPKASEAPEPAGAGEAGITAPVFDESESALYQLFDHGLEVATRDDGSLLRVVLHAIGSSSKAHKVSLQLFTGTGWTELRRGDGHRWIDRGARGAHPRDALLASLLTDDGSMRSEIDSETLATLLRLLALSDALVDRGGRSLGVSLLPWHLRALLRRAAAGAVGLEISCEAPGADRDTSEIVPFDEVAIIPSVSPWIQLSGGSFHPLESPVPGFFLEKLQEELLESIEGKDLDRFLGAGVGLLQRLCLGNFESEPGLIREVEGVEAARIRLEGTTARLFGLLEFSYGGEWMRAPESPESFSLEVDGEIRKFPPAGQSLARAREELEGIGFRLEDEGWCLEGGGVLARILEPRPGAFVTFTIPETLESLNLVDRAPVLSLNVGRPGGGSHGGATEDGEGASTVQWGGNALSWFEASYSLVDGDRELDIDLDELHRAMLSRSQSLLQLEDGSVVSLEHEALRSLFELSSAARDRPRGDAGELKLSLAELSELLDERAGRQVEFQAAIGDLIQSLQSSDELAPPQLEDAIAETLRPYQRDAVRWFHHLSRFGLAGILADEMGLGKTVMTLSHLFGKAESSRVDRLPALVVCPSSLTFNWIDECRRFFPGVQTAEVYGVARAKRESLVQGGADLFVTSYALLRRDRELWEATSLRVVVLDEGQHIKNAESQTAQAAFALVSAERWILTGTPVENHLGELWSQFHFLMPGFLGKRSEFSKRYADPIRKGDKDALRRLQSRLRPFILRRRKDQVLKELPPRIEQVERVAMTASQRRLYEEYLARIRGEIEGEGDASQSRFQILAALTRLRQICCHPRLVLDAEAESDRDSDGDSDGGGSDGKPDGVVDSGKMDLLMELLEECVEEEHRVLLFSQFTSMLDIIQAELRERGIRYARLDGSTRDRAGEVRRFQEDDKIPVFLISLKAGGYGLNLTQADTVIIYDPWWNPATEEQAAARAHRMGQTLPVHVHKLITAGSVEEKILELQASKRELAASIIENEGEAIASLNISDLRQLIFD